VDGRHGKDTRASVQGGEVDVGDDTDEFDTAPCSKPPKQLGIIAFGWVVVVAGGPHHAQRIVLGERLDQAVNALVRGQPSNEEDAATVCLRVGREANRIGTSINDGRSRSRRR
jgi:hypothetical protein